SADAILLVEGLAALPARGQPRGDKLDGTWEITAMIEDGALVSADTIKNKYAHDGRVIISGQTLQFEVPGTGQKRSVLFVADSKARPKTIDLGGTDKTNGKGIYMLDSDVCMLCIGEPRSPGRPTEFAAPKGSPNILMTLKRIAGNEIVPVQADVVPPVNKDAELTKSLLGTWGHQDDDWIYLYTLNPDGTFMATQNYKHKFGKLFHEDVRSSGTWKIQDGLMLATITASTDRERLQQVSS